MGGCTERIEEPHKCYSHWTLSNSHCGVSDVHGRPIDGGIFLRNPVIMSAMAEGLCNQEAQVRCLTIDDIVKFLETPGSAPEQLLNALFRERQVSYWERCNEGPDKLQRRTINIGLVPKAQLLPNNSWVEFMNVASLPITYADFVDNMRAHRPLEEAVIERI